VGSVWIGLTVSYLADRIPPSFAILATATLAYLLAALARPVARAPVPATR
jgi:zinc/manganese transport system permease protein